MGLQHVFFLYNYVFQGSHVLDIHVMSMITHTAWKVSKYGVISGPYFPVFGLNTEIYEVNLRIQSGKYGPEISPYLGTFHAVLYTSYIRLILDVYLLRLLIWCKYYMTIKPNFKDVKRSRRYNSKCLFVTWVENPDLL